MSSPLRNPGWWLELSWAVIGLGFVFFVVYLNAQGRLTAFECLALLLLYAIWRRGN